MILLKGLLFVILTRKAKCSAPGQMDNIEYLMFFLIYGLGVGLILLGVKSKTNIPYTPMLLIFGLFVGYFADSLWRFGDSMKHIAKMSSHTLLFVFIPPLIFESAFGADVFVFS